MRATTTNPDDGTEIAYEVNGSGPALMLVHGSGLSKGTWRGLGYLRDFERDFTVVTLDMRGHGRSGKPHDPADYTHQAFVADVDAVLDATGLGPVHYVGYSFGARIGLRLALDQPERLVTLTSIGGSFTDLARAVGETFFPTWREALETVGDEGGQEGGQEGGGDRGDGRGGAGGMAEFLRRWAEHRGGEIDPATALAFRANDPAALSAYFQALEVEQSIGLEAASRIQVPTLLVAGTFDTGRIDEARAAAKVMPFARFVELEGQDHGSSLLPVDEVTDLVRTFVEMQEAPPTGVEGAF